ncbi:hypothetical protein K523DRAFT_361897 [Schizophyllum commune Tattone D]|nr:hypothetical protein K525DRAFT_283155 [Schizophyllum commune Loenen D]KAI5832110.1 hypothetical protein K523DRAFT_361897 [Schizophyllum commune Tattone D]
MKFTALIPALLSASSAFALVHPRATSNTTIATFLSDSVNAFFPAPGNDGWETAFDAAFAPNLTATFNDGSYDFAGFRAYFAAVKANLESKYSTFDHSFTSVVGVSATGGNTGGYGIVTGVEGGDVSGTQVRGTDGAFAVIREIDGALKITEWHEITNLGA